MRLTIFIICFCFFSLFAFASGSSLNLRRYQPVSMLENEIYQQIDKRIWPDDVRNNIEKYKKSKIAWVGVVEEFMTDFTNPEYNLIRFYLKHHYYNWMENLEPQRKPIDLSTIGEGYFVCYYILGKETDSEDIAKDFVGEVIINYGSPIGILENNAIEMSTDYLRIIDKEYVRFGGAYERNGPSYQ